MDEPDDDTCRLAVAAAIDAEITMHHHKWCSNDGSGVHAWGRPRSGMKEVRVRSTSVKAVHTAIRTKGINVRTYARSDGTVEWSLFYWLNPQEDHIEYRFRTREAVSHFEEAAKAAKLRDEMRAMLPKAAKRPKQRRARPL